MCGWRLFTLPLGSLRNCFGSSTLYVTPSLVMPSPASPPTARKEDCAHRTDTWRTGSVMKPPWPNMLVSVPCDCASSFLHWMIDCSDGMCREDTVRICSRTDVG